MKTYSKDHAVQLSRALSEQLARRMPSMRLEIQYGLGMHITDKNFVKPKPWVLRASRIALADLNKLFGEVSLEALATPHQQGALVGLAKTFKAVLSGTGREETELEKNHPEYAAFRTKIAAVVTPEIELGDRINENVAASNLPAEGELLYGKGRYEGSQMVVDKTGQYVENSSIRQYVCWFLWLYWPELRFVKSMPDLLVFLKDFQENDLTIENLTKICRDIDLRFKGRGRPAK